MNPDQNNTDDLPESGIFEIKTEGLPDRLRGQIDGLMFVIDMINRSRPLLEQHELDHEDQCHAGSEMLRAMEETFIRQAATITGSPLPDDFRLEFIETCNQEEEAA